MVSQTGNGLRLDDAIGPTERERSECSCYAAKGGCSARAKRYRDTAVFGLIEADGQGCAAGEGVSSVVRGKSTADLRIESQKKSQEQG